MVSAAKALRPCSLVASVRFPTPGQGPKPATKAKTYILAQGTRPLFLPRPRPFGADEVQGLLVKLHSGQMRVIPAHRNRARQYRVLIEFHLQGIVAIAKLAKYLAQIRVVYRFARFVQNKVLF